MLEPGIRNCIPLYCMGCNSLYMSEMPASKSFTVCFLGQCYEIVRNLVFFFLSMLKGNTFYIMQSSDLLDVLNKHKCLIFQFCHTKFFLNCTFVILNYQLFLSD